MLYLRQELRDGTKYCTVALCEVVRSIINTDDGFFVNTLLLHNMVNHAIRDGHSDNRMTHLSHFKADCTLTVCAIHTQTKLR